MSASCPQVPASTVKSPSTHICLSFDLELRHWMSASCPQVPASSVNSPSHTSASRLMLSCTIKCLHHALRCLPAVSTPSFTHLLLSWCWAAPLDVCIMPSGACQQCRLPIYTHLLIGWSWAAPLNVCIMPSGACQQCRLLLSHICLSVDVELHHWMSASCPQVPVSSAGSHSTLQM